MKKIQTQKTVSSSDLPLVSPSHPAIPQAIPAAPCALPRRSLRLGRVGRASLLRKPRVPSQRGPKTRLVMSVKLMTAQAADGWIWWLLLGAIWIFFLMGHCCCLGHMGQIYGSKKTSITRHDGITLVDQRGYHYGWLMIGSVNFQSPTRQLISANYKGGDNMLSGNSTQQRDAQDFDVRHQSAA